MLKKSKVALARILELRSTITKLGMGVNVTLSIMFLSTAILNSIGRNFQFFDIINIVIFTLLLMTSIIDAFFVVSRKISRGMLPYVVGISMRSFWILFATTLLFFAPHFRNTTYRFWFELAAGLLATNIPLLIAHCCLRSERIRQKLQSWWGRLLSRLVEEQCTEN